MIDACLALKDFNKGALGPWSFDENGDTTIKTVSGSVIRRRVDQPAEGKFEFVKLLTPFPGRVAASRAAAPGLSASDHANMIWAALRLNEATNEQRYFDQAAAWSMVLDKHYWVDGRGGRDGAAIRFRRDRSPRAGRRGVRNRRLTRRSHPGDLGRP